MWSEAEHALFEKAVERSLAHATSGDASSDNISWVAVSQLVGTRSSAQCMNHWQNRSVRGKSMEARGLWADGAQPAPASPSQNGRGCGSY